MLRKALQIISVLAICLVLLSTGGTAKQQVERPDKGHGQMTLAIDLTNYILYGDPVVPWSIESERGESTHTGLYTSTGTGTVNFLTGVISGSGPIIAANGDQLYWTMTGMEGSPTIGLTYSGGTGRFENAVGSAVETIVPIGDPVWEGFVEKVTYSVSFKGTLTY